MSIYMFSLFRNTRLFKTKLVRNWMRFDSSGIDLTVQHTPASCVIVCSMLYEWEWKGVDVSTLNMNPPAVDRRHSPLSSAEKQHRSLLQIPACKAHILYVPIKLSHNYEESNTKQTRELWQRRHVGLKRLDCPKMPNSSLPSSAKQPCFFVVPVKPWFVFLFTHGSQEQWLYDDYDRLQPMHCYHSLKLLFF